MRRDLWIAALALASVCACAGVSLGKPAAPAPKKKAEAPDVLARVLGREFTPLVEKTNGGQIDWTHGVAFAVGTSRVAGRGGQATAMARRAARLIAARNAALLSAGVRMGPGGRCQNIKSGRISADVVVKDFKETESRYDPKSNTVTSKIALPLHGTQGVVTLRNVRFGRSDRRWAWPEGTGGHEAVDVIVIDARGMGFLPCLAPRVILQNGKCLFEGGDVKADQLRDRPAVAYVKFMSKPGPSTKNPLVHLRALGIARKGAIRAGGSANDLTVAAKKRFKNALILQAIDTPDDSPETIILPNTTVRFLMLHPEARQRFKDGKVVVVVDGVKVIKKRPRKKK